MAGRNINVSITNFAVLGNVSIPDAQMDITADWTGADGLPKSDSRAVRFFAILATLTPAQRRALYIDLMWRALRIVAGIDDDL